MTHSNKSIIGLIIVELILLGMIPLCRIIRPPIYVTIGDGHDNTALVTPDRKGEKAIAMGKKKATERKKKAILKAEEKERETIRWLLGGRPLKTWEIMLFFFIFFFAFTVFVIYVEHRGDREGL